jgi:hypothetical protein
VNPVGDRVGSASVTPEGEISVRGAATSPDGRKVRSNLAAFITTDGVGFIFPDGWLGPYVLPTVFGFPGAGPPYFDTANGGSGTYTPIPMLDLLGSGFDDGALRPDTCVALAANEKNAEVHCAAIFPDGFVYGDQSAWRDPTVKVRSGKNEKSRDVKAELVIDDEKRTMRFSIRVKNDGPISIQRVDITAPTIEGADVFVDGLNEQARRLLLPRFMVFPGERYQTTTRRFFDENGDELEVNFCQTEPYDWP